MKKLTLILVAMLISSIVQIPLSSAATDNARITGIEISGKQGAIIWGTYEIKIEYGDGFVTYQVSGVINPKTAPSGTKVCKIKNDNERLKSGDDCDSSDVEFWVQAYYASSSKKMYVNLGSPLTEEESLTMDEGDSENFPQYSTKIKVVSVDDEDNEVKVEVTLPDGSKKSETIEEGDYETFDAKAGDYTYKYFVKVEVTNIKDSNTAKLKIYFPKYPALKLEVKSSGAETEQPEEVQGTLELIYNDILYSGEILTIKTNGTVAYKLKLNSVGYYSSFSVFDKNNKPIKTFTVKEGSGYQLSQVPIRVEIPPNSVDLTYNRIKVRLYGPQGSEVQPIIREANIKVELSISTTKILLDRDELIVFVNVENQGRGKAFDVNVAAPIPNGFELRSGIGTWNLKMLDAFTKMPVLVYTLKPTQVGSYKLGPVNVQYYNEAGEKKVIKSNTINQIIVYGLPKLSLVGEAFNGTWSTYVHTQEKTVKLKFTVSAEGKDAKYEFIKNATIKLLLPDSLDGETELFVGDVKAGETKTLESEYAILKPDNAIISAMLVYQDPLGNWHEENFGNLVIVNSLPPAVEIKEVKVYPSPEELPQYVNSTLAELDNKTRGLLAEKLKNISVSYLPPEKGINWWPILTILFLIASAVLAYSYMDLKSKYEKALKELGRRKRKPGGLPKKEEALKPEEKATEEAQS
ncbi:MAG: DNA cytosine methyltransferase [Thermococcus sp.]|nr:DNA cytosine methyltransferase [Thermococcus sp.]